jgi:acetylornithine/N-succinyldiaminopimelate aminotransferase
MPTYSRLPVRFSHGEGCWLYTPEGDKYLDTISGIAVNGLGHAHPNVADALADQAKKLIHTSNLYAIDNQERLADVLCDLSGMQHVFFSNSGAEANEAAIKIARKYGHDRGIERPEIIVMEHSFHGRTLATLSATGNPKVQQGFAPLVAGFVRVAYNDIAAIQSSINTNTVAILVEPIQGEGGVNIPDDDYLSAIRAVCDEHQLLMMLDEIQTGMGRTGRWFAFQHHDGWLPDVMTLAKSLANGVPIGACLVAGLGVDILGAGNHGSTFGGNPLACRAALATIDVLKHEDLISRSATAGQKLITLLQQKLATTPGVQDIRGKGMIVGIELDRDASSLPLNALNNKLLLNVTAGNVVRLLPPLIMTDDELEIMSDTVCTLITDFMES